MTCQNQINDLMQNVRDLDYSITECVAYIVPQWHGLGSWAEISHHTIFIIKNVHNKCKLTKHLIYVYITIPIKGKWIYISNSHINSPDYMNVKIKEMYKQPTIPKCVYINVACEQF